MTRMKPHNSLLIQSYLIPSACVLCLILLMMFSQAGKSYICRQLIAAHVNVYLIVAHPNLTINLVFSHLQ